MNDEKESIESIRDSLRNSWRSVINTLQAAYELVPFMVIVLAGLLAGLIALLVNFGFWLESSSIAVVIVVALTLLFRTNYGEAALSLIIGILTVYSIEWTIGRYVLFMGALLGFSFLTLLVYSIKMASESEDIINQAAVWLTENEGSLEEIEKKLEKLSKQSNTILGPIDRAKSLRILAFRNVPLKAMDTALDGVERLSVITKIDFELVATTVANLYKVLEKQKAVTIFEGSIDQFYNTMNDSPVPPGEFIKSFNKHRRVLLEENTDLKTYLADLKEGLSKGKSGEELYERVRKVVR